MPSSDQAAKGVGFLTTALASPVSPAEAALRPLSFADFAGQAKTVERLRVMVGAAKRRGDALNHILLSGPPGLGKTTLAFILGHELSAIFTGVADLKKVFDAARGRRAVGQGTLLFVDEIHRFNRAQQDRRAVSSLSVRPRRTGSAWSHR